MENLGKIVPTPKGIYDAGTVYNRLDIVSYEGSSYACTKDRTKGISPLNVDTWKLIASKGDEYELTEEDKAEIAEIAVGSGVNLKKFFVDEDGYLCLETVEPAYENLTYKIIDGELYVEY